MKALKPKREVAAAASLDHLFHQSPQANNQVQKYSSPWNGSHMRSQKSDRLLHATTAI